MATFGPYTGKTYLKSYNSNVAQTVTMHTPAKRSFVSVEYLQGGSGNFNHSIYIKTSNNVKQYLSAYADETDLGIGNHNCFIGGGIVVQAGTPIIYSGFNGHFNLHIFEME